MSSQHEHVDVAQSGHQREDDALLATERFQRLYLPLEIALRERSPNSRIYASRIAGICESAVRIAKSSYGADNDAERIFLFALAEVFAHSAVSDDLAHPTHNGEIDREALLFAIRDLDGSIRFSTSASLANSVGDEYFAVARFLREVRPLHLGGDTPGAASRISPDLVRSMCSSDVLWYAQCDTSPLALHYDGQCDALDQTNDQEEASAITSAATVLDRGLLSVKHALFVPLLNVPATHTEAGARESLLLEMFFAEPGDASLLDVFRVTATSQSKPDREERSRLFREFVSMLYSTIVQEAHATSRVGYPGDPETRELLYTDERRRIRDRVSSLAGFAAEIASEFPALEAFADYFEGEVAIRLGRRGWSRMFDPSVAALPFFQRCAAAHEESARMSVALLIGRSTPDQPRTIHSYLLRSTDVRRLADVFHMPDILKFWEKDFTESNSVVGYLERSRFPVVVNNPRDVRLLGYGGETLAIEKTAFVPFSHVLQIPLLWARPSNGEHLALTAVFLSTCQLGAELRTALWDTVHHARAAALAAWSTQIRLPGVRSATRDKAYEEQVRAWGHEVGQLSLLFGPTWVQEGNAHLDAVQAMPAAQVRLVGPPLYIPYGSLFKATRDYMWLWAPPKGGGGEVSKYLAANERMDDFLEVVVALAHSAGLAQFCKNSHVGADAIEHLALYDRHVDLKHTSYWPEAANFARTLLQPQDQRPSLQSYLKRALVAALLNALKHTLEFHRMRSGLTETVRLLAWPKGGWPNADYVVEPGEGDDVIAEQGFAVLNEYRTRSVLFEQSASSQTPKADGTLKAVRVMLRGLEPQFGARVEALRCTKPGDGNPFFAVIVTLDRPFMATPRPREFV